MTKDQKLKRMENMTPLEKERGRYLSVYRDDIEMVRNGLDDKDRLLIVDGLFDWFLGKEHGLQSALAFVVEKLIDRHMSTWKASFVSMRNGSKNQGQPKASQSQPKASQSQPKQHTIPIPIPITIPDKENILKESRAIFTPPTIEEVRAYCAERGNGVDADKWHDFYTSKGWMVGKNKMRDWRAAVRTWERGNSRQSILDGYLPPSPGYRNPLEEMK